MYVARVKKTTEMWELHENRVHFSHVRGIFECKMCDINHISWAHAKLAPWRAGRPPPAGPRSSSACRLARRGAASAPVWRASWQCVIASR